ncbi:MAG: 50S ribosomal protein L25 [Candidatus Hydrogenedentota bacterium]
MAELLTIKVTKRDTGNKSLVRFIRRNGDIPGIIYSSSIEPIPILINPKELDRILHKKIKLFEVELNSKKYPVIIKAIQKDVVTDKIIHFDFQNIKLDEEVTTNVSITITGISPGIKMGGILDILLKSIKIKCLPLDIPEKIEVDISNLKINDALHIKELKFSDKIKVLHSQDETVVVVVPPAKEEELEVSKAAVEEPEVIKKGKEEEEEVEEGAAATPLEKPKAKEEAKAKETAQTQDKKEKPTEKPPKK